MSFKRTDRTKKERVLSLDWCPKCGVKLPDRLESTKITHDLKEHPKTTKQKIYGYIGSHFLAWLIIGICALVLLVIIAPYSPSPCSESLLLFGEEFKDVLLSEIPTENISELEKVCAEDDYKLKVVMIRDYGIRDSIAQFSP